VVLRTSVTLQIRQLNRFLFHDLGFGENPSEYLSPCNCCMNEVLELNAGFP
jgi:regulator of sirC expression with transglutaminase-like and TPR domain